MLQSLFERLVPSARKMRLARLRDETDPRRARIHSIIGQPESRPADKGPDYYRVAFELLDPPGPWSMQFYEAARGQDLLDELEPGLEVRYYESRDGARRRMIETTDGRILLPR